MVQAWDIDQLQNAGASLGRGGMQEPRWADLSKMADGADEGQA